MQADNTTHALRITNRDVHERKEVFRLARTDKDAALSIARKIAHPWYRCQALSAVAAETRSVPLRVRLLGEAVASAYEQPEPNRIASVAAWPLRVLVSTDTSAARALTARLLATIATEPHGLRRLDGLRAVLGAGLASRELRDLALPAFECAVNTSVGWRTERIVSFMAIALAEVDLPAAKALLARRGTNRFVAKARAALDAPAP